MAVVLGVCCASLIRGVFNNIITGKHRTTGLAVYKIAFSAAGARNKIVDIVSNYIQPVGGM